MLLHAGTNWSIWPRSRTCGFPIFLFSNVFMLGAVWLRGVGLRDCEVFRVTLKLDVLFRSDVGSCEVFRVNGQILHV